MKTPRSMIAAFIAALLTIGTALAADTGNPTGNWKWSLAGRDGQAREVTAKLEFKDGKLTGSVAGRQGDNPISDASFVDGVVKFSTSFGGGGGGGGGAVTKYQGKLEGNTITGTIDRGPGRDGAARPPTEWKATKVE